MRTRWGALVVLLLPAVLAMGCTRGGEKRGDQSSLTPQFAPDTAVATTTTSSPRATSTTRGEGTTATSTSTSTPTGASSSRPPGQVAAPVVEGATTAAIVDRQGDLTQSTEPPPPWADLIGGTLIRRADGFELRVRLGGGSAPSTTDQDHTMNIASFYDLNGDGTVDHEVWANLADGGWGGSWFDNRGRKAWFNDDSGVAIDVAGDEVVLRFPLSRVGGAERFRWSLASEWGRYDALSTSGTARDDAPDFDAAARFPG